MTEEEARAEIVNLLKERNQYAVIWWGHWGDYFHILSNAKGRRKNDIYGAMCEQYYDVVEDDTKVADIWCGEPDGCNNRELRAYVLEHQKEQK